MAVATAPSVIESRPDFAIDQKEVTMPTLNVQMFEGRTVDEKRAFVEAVTSATCETLGVGPESVGIVITDIKRENWATAGKLWSENKK